MSDVPGTDIVSVARIAALVEGRGERFLERWFTPAELAYCRGKAVPSRHLAARIAAKEAVAKALRLAWDGPLPWRCVEVVSGAHGVPSVRLSGRVAEAASAAGIAEVQVSLAHCDDYATAVALAQRGPG